MAAALLDASLVVMLGVVTVSDLRTRLVPDGPLIASLALALGLYGLFAPNQLPERLAAGSVVGMALIARHGWAARSRTIAFAPCLALGGLVAMALRL
jgi:prepilin signal peptidase PulO-like enzyme (type II secretory pathway)